MHQPAFAKTHEEAFIVDLDEDRVRVIDKMMQILFQTLHLVEERLFADALRFIYKVFLALRELQEYLCVVAAGKVIAQLMHSLNLKREACQIYGFLRDLCEETYNSQALISVYDKMAEMLRL